MANAPGACRLFLLMLAAASVSSGSDIREYYKEEFSARESDVIVLASPINELPLACMSETVIEWSVQELTVSSFLLSVPGANTRYRCTYGVDIPTDIFWKGFLNNFHGAIVRSGKENLEFRPSKLVCTNDTQIPDEYFHLNMVRPLEGRVLRCRVRRLDDRLYLKFLKFPTIICRMGPITPKPSYTFKLPGIVGDPFECAFLVYSDMRIHDTSIEERLYNSLLSKFPNPVDGVQPRVKCSRNATTTGSLHFLVQLPKGALHDCSFYTS